MGGFQYLLENRINHTHGTIDSRRVNPPKGRLRLVEVEQIFSSGSPPASLFTFNSQEIVPPQPDRFTLDFTTSHKQPNGSIRFRSPCRIERKVPNLETGIKGKKKLIGPELFSPEMLIQSLKTRTISLMAQFATSDNDLMQHIDTIKAYVDDTTQWVSKNMDMNKVIRVKPKTGRWRHCDGFTGSLTLADIHPYTSQLMAFASIMHLGKFATYGYGEIEMAQ